MTLQLASASPRRHHRFKKEEGRPMKDRFERHRQAWTTDEIQKLHRLAGKGMSLKAIAKSLTRSEESTKKRAKEDKLTVRKVR